MDVARRPPLSTPGGGGGGWGGAGGAARQPPASPPPQPAHGARQWLRAIRGRQAPVLDERQDPAQYAYVVTWYNPALSAAQVDAVVRSVLYFSDRYGVDPRLVMSLVAVESGL